MSLKAQSLWKFLLRKSLEKCLELDKQDFLELECLKCSI